MNRPSLEKDTDSAEMPPKNGRNCLLGESKRESSPRRVVPAAKIFLPSLLATGLLQRIGPEVNLIGSVGECRSSPRRSSMAQICLPDKKTKTFPSAVQRPQHWPGEALQTGSTRWRFEPVDDISQRKLSRVKRIALPSGDQVRKEGKPTRVVNLWAPVPSLRTT